MIRKSVETRDWLNTIEPRNVVLKIEKKKINTFKLILNNFFKKKKASCNEKDCRRFYKY
jgi:hypothetical protein